MPILKPISGHGSTGGIRRYLEKVGRNLVAVADKVEELIGEIDERA